MATVTIIGSGIVGAAQALHTALRGARVRLLDTRHTAGQAASLANTGYICPGIAATPLCRTAALRYHAKHRVRVQHPAPPGLMSWAARFAFQPRWWPPGQLQQLEEWAALSAEEWRDLAGPPRGAVSIWRTGAHDDQRAALARRLPQLDLGGIRGHLWCPSDTFVDPEKAVQDLVQRWPRDSVEYWPNTSVVGFHTAPSAPRVTHIVTTGGDEIPVDDVVIAAGAGTPELLAELLPYPPPLVPLCGYSIDVKRCDGGPTLAAHAISDLDQGVTLAPLRDGEGMRIAGFLDVATRPPWIVERHIQLERTVRRLFPGIPLHVVRRWCGVRLATPTGVPLVGRLAPWHNVYVNAGHGRVGMTLSLGTARWLSRQIGA